MSDPRWDRAVELFHSALERPQKERAAYLRAACGGDESLYRTVSSLVAADRGDDDGPIEQIAQAAAADLMTQSRPEALVGQQIARYRVVSHLGSGGMGEVYRATDPALGRDVALKLLTRRFQTDASLWARLEKEARAASSLNHPNIVTIYEIGSTGPYEFIASELVDGDTLRHVIARRPMPLPELADIGGQIAAGLAAAHAAGIIHRDIKPENVMIRRDGLVKILDFGLAKSAIAGGQHASDVTRAVDAAHTGGIAGTACYMSPEQALGKQLDHRSDLFSVGVVLYEMATGIRPFAGPSDAAMYDALLHASAAAPSAVRRDLPPALDAVIGRALEKDPELRYQSASDLAADMKRLQRPPSAAPLAMPPPSPARAVRVWQAAAIVAAALTMALVFALLRQQPDTAGYSTRFTIAPPPGTTFTLTGTVVPSFTVTVSPDGRQVVFLANEQHARGRLWVRSLDVVDAVPLDGTEDATFPFWSPDGKSVAFFVEDVLRVKPLTGGAARTIAVTERGRGGTWNRDGIILFGTAEGAIYRVSSAGGAPSPVTTLDRERGESWHRFPEFLPDGNHFLYLARSGDTRTLSVGSLDGKPRKRLFETDVRASYAQPGYVLFVEKGALLARRFDADTLEFRGEPVELAPSVGTSTALDASFAASGTGVLAYAARPSAKGQLTWFDRSGQSLGATGTPSEYLAVRLSHDEKTVVVARSGINEDAPDLWLLDVDRGATSRFTFNRWLDISPVWSPDSEAIVFSSSRAGRFELFRRAARGGAEEVRFFTGAAPTYADDWSRDGKYIVYSSELPGHSWDLGLLDVAASRSVPLVTSSYDEYQGRISPDGQWLAFTSNETGQPEVYARPFPAGNANVLMSTGGGSEPVWRRDGKELFYLAPDGALMAVPVTVFAGRIRPARPQSLFRTQIPGHTLRNGSTYAATADGQRFLITTAAAENEASAITVIVDWLHAVGP